MENAEIENLKNISQEKLLLFKKIVNDMCVEFINAPDSIWPPCIRIDSEYRDSSITDKQWNEALKQFKHDNPDSVIFRYNGMNFIDNGMTAKQEEKHASPNW